MATSSELLSGRLPCVHLPQDSAEAVREEVRRRAAELGELLDAHGGFLVTAPALKSATDFHCALEYIVDVATEYPGGAPRDKILDGVFSSTRFAEHLPIPAHTELSYMPRARPELIAFFCETAPRFGGMTPVVDMAEVLRRLPADLVARFAPGLKTSLNMPPDRDAYLCARYGTVRQHPRVWTDFGQSRVEAARSFCANSRDEVVVEWTKDWMQPYIAMPAVGTHMGMQVWTGFFPLFHWAGPAIQTVFDLLWHHRTLGQLRSSFWVLGITAWHVLANRLSNLPGLAGLLRTSANPGALSCKLQNGQDVSFWDCLRILWTYNTQLIKWRWQPGQFVLLDNHRLGHMRTPYPAGEPRRILTAFGSRKAALNSHTNR